MYFLFVIMFFLIVYHHVFYPLILKMVKESDVKKSINEYKGKVAIVISSYNEEAFILKKIKNTLDLDFENKHIYVYNDGSSDKTEKCLEVFKKNKLITIINKKTNKGKLESINHFIKNSKENYEATLFTDTSSELEKDALNIMLSELTDEKVAVCSSSYYPHKDSKDAKYWNYQRSVKRKESQMGDVIGVHGSGYVIKNSFLNVLHENTINDDFEIPSKAIKLGGKVVYSNAKSLEMENDINEDLNYTRRIRIGAGNLQQFFSNLHLLNVFKHPLTTFNYFSGKVLRTLMPFIYLLSLIFAFSSLNHEISVMYLMLNVLLFTYVIIYKQYREKLTLKYVNIPYYIVKSYYNSFRGMMHYILIKEIKGWYNPMKSRRKVFAKRIFDITLSTILLIVSLPVLLLSMLALKIESPNAPVFFKQKRVGEVKDGEIYVFEVFKLRSMIVDAEKETGVVFASRGDSRITRVGRFIRKTRMDEIPQFFNVFNGDMSLVGPRPERPEVMSMLEIENPYDRTVGVKPGITGLAQIIIGYNEDMASIENKFKIDKDYKDAQTSITKMYWEDIKIVFKTVFVVLSMKGI